MLKRIVTYGLCAVLTLLIGLHGAGFLVKKANKDRIAPGITVWGKEVSGLTVEEARGVVRTLLPEVLVEIHCRFLPEMQKEIETGAMNDIQLSVRDKELCLTGNESPVRVLEADTLAAVIERSSEVKLWEWLYAKVTGRAFQTRQVRASFVWDEAYFRGLVEECGTLVERDYKDATVSPENGTIKVAESERGFRIEREEVWKEAERVAKETVARLQEAPVDGMVLRFYLDGTVLMPRVTTSHAKNCDTVIGEFYTAYAGAGTGRAQNIAAGAEKLHGKVILPGETFSVAAVLQPFTEANGYAAGGTYIEGQLSESIGGGVCQLSTTLYNALLQTTLPITERHPHSMPVGYVPLGRDAAIAGDYKDLKFKNTSEVPVLLLCEITGKEVKVTLYGGAEAERGNVRLESVTVEETNESVTVEVYREETGENGVVRKERVSSDTYRYREDKSF